MDPWSKVDYSRYIREASMVVGEAPGGDPSLRQGAGKGSSDAPDLGSATAVEQR